MANNNSQAAKLDEFEPLFAEAPFEDPDQAYARQERLARQEARSAARAEAVSLSALSGSKGQRKAGPGNGVMGSSMMEAMRENKNLSQAVELFERANLAEYIDAQGRMGDAVIFAPTNAAFDAIDKDALKSIKASTNLDALKISMRGHIAPAQEQDDLYAAAGYDQYADEYEERKSAQPGHSLALRYRNDSEDATPYIVLGSNKTGAVKASAAFAHTITFPDIPGKVQIVKGHLIPE